MFRFRTALAGIAVAAAAVLAVAAPASAHDKLVGSTPAADEQLTTAPEEVTLTFSNNLLSLEENSGTAMTVVDGAGKDWVAGDPVVQADTVTVPLAQGMTDGDYLVTWKVVSSDGHPTDGQYSFSLTGQEAVETTAPSEEPSDEPSAEASTPAQDGAAAQDDSALMPILIGVGALVVVLGVAIGVAVSRKRRS